MNILIISSSVRQGRQSHRAALGIQKYIQSLANNEVKVIDLMQFPLPLLEATFGSQVAPAKQSQYLHDELNWADAMIFVSPEYNGSYSSALKNFVDTFAKGPFKNKPIGVASVTSGEMGGMRAALQMQALVLAIFAFPMPEMLLIPKVTEQFNPEGELINPAFEAKMERFGQQLLWLTQKLMG